MLRLALLGALMWGLVGITIIAAYGCAEKPVQKHDELIQWNIYAQPPFALLEACYDP